MPNRMMKSAILSTIVLSLAGCGKATSVAPVASPPPPPEIMLYCGAAFRKPAEEAVAAFEKTEGCRVIVDYAGSETLLSRIKLSRQGDVYWPGDSYYSDLAEKEGLISVGSRKTVAYFVPCIFVARGNPKGVKSLPDFLRDDVRAGLGNPKACAIGKTSEELFKKNGIPWEKIGPQLRFQSATVNELGTQIQTGSLDAVVLWDAIAAMYAEHGEMVAIPVEQNIVVTVDMGVLTFAKNPGAAAKFVDFMTSEKGREILKKHQFRVDAPSGSPGKP
ncbi:MAG: molybdate ABC transporter substrate-binding protein [Planctomycetota bacterium]